MTNTETGLLIAILVVTVAILLFLIEIYRKVLYIFEFNAPEAPPPASFRFSNSFVDKNKKHKPIVVE